MKSPKKRTIKAWAVVSKKTGNIKYMSDSWYSPLIASSKKKAEDYDEDSHYKIIPITITYHA